MDTLGAEFKRDALPRLPDPDFFLFRAVGRIHAAIDEHAARLSLPDSPRTTLVACVVQEGCAWWTHIGDSRFYHIRRGRILARSRDHTRVQQLVDEGRIREEAVSSHPQRNMVLQCLGGGQALRIEPTASALLERDDVLLLCSDGFWGPLTQRQLLGKLAGNNLIQVLPELMTLAESRAGPGCDNLSVVAIGWGEDAVARPAEAPITVPMRDLPTDVQDFSATDPDFAVTHMSDEDIERAIADLKAALKHHHPGKK
jgi:serine/threonine protein phosphatase PrpC